MNDRTVFNRVEELNEAVSSILCLVLALPCSGVSRVICAGENKRGHSKVPTRVSHLRTTPNFATMLHAG